MSQPSANTYLRTPQGVDDQFDSSYIAGSDSTISLGNILENDGGGKAKRLWSLSADTESSGDDVSELLDPLDFTNPVTILTDLGGEVTIDSDGNVTYVPPSGASCDDISDSFSYSIRMANGTLSTAEVQINVDVKPPAFYEGELSAGESGTGSVSSAGSFRDFDPVTGVADYWSIKLKAGDSIVVEGERLEQDFDMSLWLFEGTITDPVTQFSGGNSSLIDSADPGFIDFADDEIPNPGPFGDPRTIVYTATEDICLTGIVTNYLSGPNDGGDGLFDYNLGVVPVV